jgi:ABC-type sugar transport system substrate-binding protein
MVAYVQPGLEVSYWDYDWWGIQQVARNTGYQARAFDYHGDASQQVSVMKTAIDSGAQGIILSPWSGPTAPAALAVAAQAHIPVVISFIGSDSGMYASLVTSADYEQGVASGTAMVKMLGGHGDVVCMCLPAGRKNAELKYQGFTKAIPGTHVHLIQIQHTTTLGIAESQSEVRDMLTAHPSVRGVIAQFDNGALGAVAAITALGKVPGKDVKIIGYDGSPQTLEDVKHGSINAMSLQQASGGGIESMETMVKVLQGKKVPHEIDLTEPLVYPNTVCSKMPWVIHYVFPPTVRLPGDLAKCAHE